MLHRRRGIGIADNARYRNARARLNCRPLLAVFCDNRSFQIVVAELINACRKRLRSAVRST